MSRQTIPLSDAVTFRGGGTPSRDVGAFWNGPIPWATVKDLNCGYALRSTQESITEEGLRRSASNLISAGTVVIPTRMALGKAVIAEIDVAINQDLKAVLPKGHIDSRFLMWFFIINGAAIEGMGKGATVKGVTLDQLGRLRFPLLPLPEQRRIAALLDKADALRAKRREAIAKLEQLLQSVFFDMFGDPVTNPKGWPVRALGELCDVRDGTHDSPKYVAEGYPLVTSKNLSGGYVSLEGAMLISEEDFHKINRRSKVHQGDLLMPMIGTVGNPVLVEDDPRYAVKNVAILKFGATDVKNSYVLHLLRSHYFDWVTSQRNRGGTQKFIALGDLRSMPVPQPDAETQARFDQFARDLTMRLDQSKAAQAQTDKLFASIQDAAFSGLL